MIKYFSRYPMRLIFLFLTIVSMIVIFMFSAENSDDSSKTSGNITKTVVETLVNDYDELPPAKQQSILDKAEHIIRKTAHFTIYMSLGLWASCTVGKRRLICGKSAAVLVYCFFYACTDEIHQSFSPGRSCQFTDVLIDTGGALVGILISMLAFSLVNLISKHRSSQKISI